MVRKIFNIIYVLGFFFVIYKFWDVVYNTLFPEVEVEQIQFLKRELALKDEVIEGLRRELELRKYIRLITASIETRQSIVTDCANRSVVENLAQQRCQAEG